MREESGNTGAKNMMNQGPVVDPVVICVRVSKLSSFSSFSSTPYRGGRDKPAVARQNTSRAARKL